MLFRVGDFSLDGYPDLLAVLVEKQSLGQIKEVRNQQERLHSTKGGSARRNQDGVVLRSEGKEDGSLDILIEYKPFEGDTKFSFIYCDDKGDVTFLKVQVFTNVCGKHCEPSSKEVGFSVSWSGACTSFSVSDGWGGSLKGASCQLPSSTHRALAAPYLLFGLGRSPNFVDELTIGAPLYCDGLAVRQHTLKQFVLNSRIVFIPFVICHLSLLSFVLFPSFLTFCILAF
ncbi:unnamed protein product [Cylicocyclus nassatus]|uniref:T-cell immunomodulatory protein TIP C2 domain-containing protein n=1 Tax=Cylicocyclus nassatus TaxID=53992 RepID=A0AA36LYJ0_CYLNA|nr:unnamed protein product [Cylicocyclus nassatus]